jgi:hypothetical protein
MAFREVEGNPNCWALLSISSHRENQVDCNLLWLNRDNGGAYRTLWANPITRKSSSRTRDDSDSE